MAIVCPVKELFYQLYKMAAMYLLISQICHFQHRLYNHNYRPTKMPQDSHALCDIYRYHVVHIVQNHLLEKQNNQQNAYKPTGQSSVNHEPIVMGALLKNILKKNGPT